jgi:hypothetical protein
VRILTTLQEGGGRTMLASYAVGLFLNLILLVQCLTLGDKAAPVRARRAAGAAPPRRRSKQA